MLRHSIPVNVFPAKAGIQRNVSWIPAFAGMTDRVSSHLRDTRLGGWACFGSDDPGVEHLNERPGVLLRTDGRIGVGQKK